MFYFLIAILLLLPALLKGHQYILIVLIEMGATKNEKTTALFD
jgi:hypothetical protein